MVHAPGFVGAVGASGERSAGRVAAFGGAAVGGILAAQFDVRAALLIMSALLAATAVYAWSSPLRRIDRAEITRLQEEAEQAP